MINKEQIKQQREAIDSLYELVKTHLLANVKTQLWRTAKVVSLLVI